MHIMHGEEMCSSSFLSSDVVDVCARDAEATFGDGAAAGAVAAFFDGTKIFRVNSVAEVERAAGSDGVPETLLSKYEWRVGGSRGLRQF